MFFRIDIHIKEEMENQGCKNSSVMKHNLSNEKRLESLKIKCQESKLQQNLIKSALADIDSGKSLNRRIVFQSDDEEEILNDKVQNNCVHSYSDNDKRQLFTDSDSDSNENTSNSKVHSNLSEDVFRLKPQFEGKKGQQLMELQVRFESDQRFHMDERFLDTEDDEPDSVKEELDKTAETMDMSAERQKNFEILQNVLGFQFPTQSAQKKLEKYRTVKDSSRLRYDPTREDAGNFEVQKESKDKGSKKKKKQKMTDPEPVELPEVSKERFFKVTSNFKDAFNDTSEKTFSFTKEFSNQNSGNEKDGGNSDYFAEPIGQLKPSFDNNFSKYESSDNEEDIPCERLQGTKEQALDNNSKLGWKFFFSADDPRLKEGVQYFQHSGTDEEIDEWWKRTRSIMLDIIQAKRKIFKRRTMVNRKRGKRGK